MFLNSLFIFTKITGWKCRKSPVENAKYHRLKMPKITGWDINGVKKDGKELK